MTATVLAPRPPRGCVEQRPMTPTEVARWTHHLPTGSLTVVLSVRRDARVMELMTGPGTAWPATHRPGDVWAWCGLLAAAGEWLAGDPPAPEPTDQLGLFDQPTQEVARP